MLEDASLCSRAHASFLETPTARETAGAVNRPSCAGVPRVCAIPSTSIPEFDPKSDERNPDRETGEGVARVVYPKLTDAPPWEELGFAS